ncbi:hypothetical protein DFH08DRAFT_191670 [Mycena albidolilacea]|uniref:Uncharacterized protein n=1 Tax=Mycena albidolilacea TaxID=1033008 RepID=A0AAD6ZZK6_9AGAR|nr:hypothetical protein DFH08DRAFT_191670 [Mycena albidolilacea]
MYAMTAPMRHHPWFDKPSVKRKRPESPTRAQKRRRSATLERGFAGLSLDAPMTPVDDPPPRPSTPVVPEITMKTSSWYEPEPDRIVITDLQSFSDEDADTVDNDASGPRISAELLARLTRPLPPSVPIPSPSQALVLFRPLVSAQSTAHKPEAETDAMDVEP